ncbi:MAG: NFACT RNA binding domain-containing protein [Leptolyngbyaceae cyanobacterium bins.349]|nr:NFACT RNA binding domain-containing protein [Leptolyngbyaceae cyanobacterium bins.349]
MQPVDFTTLMAIAAELRTTWLPARLEQVYQRDRYTLFLGLRTLEHRGWLLLSWHPQAARLGISSPPPRTPDTFTFSQQVRHQVGNLALVGIEAIAPWERVLDLQFARRPGDPILWHLYLEVMGKYSNAVLANQENQIITAAHQVSSQQSSLRPIQTGQPYELPPILTNPIPTLTESGDRWQERISLVPGPLRKNLLRTYRGVSSAIATTLLQTADLDPNQSTETLTPSDWQQLFQQWQRWLEVLEHQQFQPGWLATGYTVLGWNALTLVSSTQALIDRYYTDQLNVQEFAQLHHQLSQKLASLLGKLQIKANGFRQRLAESDQADGYREQADLLMAHLHEWQPGLKSMTLADFVTSEPVTVPLDPEKNAVQNAQALYKRHQKLKRARGAIAPLLEEVTQEIHYLEQVEASLQALAQYQTQTDLDALQEIRDELVQQNYLEKPDYGGPSAHPDNEASQPYRYQSPTGFEVLVGRNNRQNDQLTFRTAGDYDLWFHTQEIPGSHVLLRLTPGSVPETADLEFVANVAAFHSRARQSEQVPVVYTEPKHVYKPRGAKPGMIIYKHERILWGRPQQVQPSSS